MNNKDLGGNIAATALTPHQVREAERRIVAVLNHAAVDAKFIEAAKEELARIVDFDCLVALALRTRQDGAQ